MAKHILCAQDDAMLGNTVRAGTFGALIGGMAALPSAYESATKGACSKEDAVHKVMMSGARTAVAAGVGAAAASLAGGNSLLRLTVMLAAGGATLHMLSKSDRPAEPATTAAPAQEA